MTSDYASAKAETDESVAAESCPSPWYWWISAPLLLIGGFGAWAFLASSDQPLALRWLAVAALALPPFIAGGFTAWWVLRSRIVANTDGLRWRGFCGWRRARWDEVTDYHERPNPNGPVNWSEVETSSGKLAFGGDRTNVSLLRTLIAERATSARAKCWAEKGLRPEDPWPRTFNYNHGFGRHALWTIGGIATLSSALLSSLFLREISSTAAELGWPMAIAEVLVKVGLVFGVPGLMLAAFMPAINDSRRRRDQSVSVDQDGVRFRSAECEVTANWDDVTNYYTGPATGWVRHGNPSVVVTRNGTFEFTQALERNAQLRELVRRYATSAVAKGWAEDATVERLGGEELCWTGQTPGVGQRVFHLRTRTNRMGIAYLGAYWCALAISVLVGPLSEKVGSDRIIVLAIAGSLSAVLLWCIWRYRSAAVLVDEYGLTHRAWNGDRFIRWEEIEEFRAIGSEGTDRAIIRARDRQIRFWLCVADATELKDEIARRAVNAKGGWKN